MILKGHVISESVQDAVMNRMKAGRFRAADLAAVAAKADAEPNIAYRVAGRMIQRERQKGNIKMAPYPIWHWVGK